MESKIKEQLDNIGKLYGYDAQSRQCIEEMAELTQAINKFWKVTLVRGSKTLLDIPRNTPEEQNLKEEIVDVLITIENLKSFISLSDEEIDKRMEKKILRQLDRIKKSEYKVDQDGFEIF